MPKEVKWAISLAVGLALLWIGWKVYAFLVTLQIVICFVLIVVIMMQSGEAADLAGAFGGAGSQTAFGPRGAATFLTKATTWCAIMFMLTSMALTMHVDNTVSSTTGTSVLQQFSKPSKSAPAAPVSKAPALPVAPTTPTPAPAPAPAAPAPSK